MSMFLTFSVLMLVVMTAHSFSFNRGSVVLTRASVPRNLLERGSYSSTRRMMADEIEPIVEVVESPSLIPVEEKKKGFFGLSITDPQDWITVALSGIILYQTIDLIAFYGAKLLGTGSS